MFSFLSYIFRRDSSGNGVYGVIPFYTPIHIYIYIHGTFVSPALLSQTWRRKSTIPVGGNDGAFFFFSLRQALDKGRQTIWSRWNLAVTT